MKAENFMCELSIVIPCYNEEETMQELARRVLAVGKRDTDNSFEVILVDDGSRDRTWDIMKDLSELNQEIVAVRLSRNHGHQLALTAGLSLVRGKYVLVIDADLQDPPEHYNAMRTLMDDESADVVYGQRRSRAGESVFKKLSASLFYKQLRRNSEIDLPLNTGDFRLMTRRISDLLVSMPERDRFIRGMVSWLGFKQIPFLYERKPRFAGETKYPLGKMIKLAVNAFTGFSMLPLRLAGKAAMMFLVVMMLFIIYAIYSWANYETLPGWTSIIILISFASAVQLYLLSILGEYIGRIYMESKLRPLFVIDTVIRAQEN